MSEKCQSCGSEETEAHPGHHEFVYGDALVPGEQVKLSAYFPVYECNACSFSWSDHKGERARDAAVRRHLRRATSKNFDLIAKKHRLISVGEAEAIYWEHQTVPQRKMLKKMSELQQDLDQTKELLARTLKENCELRKQNQAGADLSRRISAFVVFLENKPPETYLSPVQVLKDLKTHLTKTTLEILNEMTPFIWVRDGEPTKDQLA